VSDIKKLNILYLEIGRGHPFYLDAIGKLLEDEHKDKIALNIIGVFDVSRGFFVSSWKAVERVYRWGGGGGIASYLYGAIRGRKKPDKKGLIENILSHDLRRYLISNKYPTLVSHPILVPMISDIVPVYYQHGEITAPYESAVNGARVIFVPLAGTADDLVKHGVPKNRIFVSGLCIEPDLAEKAEEYFRNRINRLRSDKPLIGAFYSSGAEPPDHLKQIVLSIASLCRSGQKGVVYCRAGGRLEKKLAMMHHAVKLNYAVDNLGLENAIRSNNIAIVPFDDRHQEHDYTMKLFRHFDYFVGPSHERTNWAAGLGLPMFVLHPIIGSFSPLNHEFLLGNGLAVDLHDDYSASNFADMLNQLRISGSLETMAKNGFGKYNIFGFRNIVEYIIGDLRGER